MIFLIMKVCIILSLGKGDRHNKGKIKYNKKAVKFSKVIIDILQKDNIENFGRQLCDKRCYVKVVVKVVRHC